jgi:hypothetical protein
MVVLLVQPCVDDQGCIHSKTHEPYKDWVAANSLLQDSWGTLIKLELPRTFGREGYAKHMLTKESVDLIEETIHEDADSSMDGDED